MASGPNIVLAATTVSFASDWYQHPEKLPNFRILMAGGLFSLFVAVLADVNERAATGLASIMFVTVLLSPQSGGQSPVGVLASLPIASPKGKVNGSSGN
jgi:hypothetical protein